MNKRKIDEYSIDDYVHDYLNSVMKSKTFVGMRKTLYETRR